MGLFDDTVVRNLFPETTVGARKLLVHRAVRSKEVLRLKRGIYCLGEVYRRSHPHPFVVAGLLHSPSHISLESALSFHTLIPEAVYEVTSVTVRRSRSFETVLGRFSFMTVPADNPRAGVHPVNFAMQSRLRPPMFLNRSVELRKKRLPTLNEERSWSRASSIPSWTPQLSFCWPPIDDRNLP